MARTARTTRTTTRSPDGPAAPYLTTGQAALALGLSRYTLLRAVRRGALTPALRTPGGCYRFHPATVEAYARTLATPADARLAAPGDSATGTRGVPVARRGAAAGAVWRAEAERLAAIIATQRDVATTDLDLDAVMALIVARAQVLTRAAGAVIELAEGDEMVYRAASGTVAAHVGVRLHLTASLSGHCVRTGAILRCDDAEADPRVDRAACRRVGARSMIVVPLHHGATVAGVLKVLSPRPSAFTETDVQTLQLMAGVLAAALSHAAAFAAERALVAARTAALQQSEDRFRATFEQAAVGLAHLALDGRFVRVNQTLCAIVGYRPAELHARTVVDLLHPADRPDDPVQGRQLVSGALTSYAAEKRLQRADGATVWVRFTVSLARTPEGAPAHLIVVVEDISARQQAEEALRHQALHDPLTDLPNRTLLHERLTQALRQAARDGRPLALLLLDLDRFKEVNDTLGHAHGDRLLQQVAARLRGAVRAADTVARLGGDEFAVLLPATDAAGALRCAQILRGVLEAPLRVAGSPILVEASVGVALGPTHGRDATTVLRCADVAMYAAKRAGSGTAVYEAAQDRHSPARLALAADLRAAIAAGALALHYQPKVEVATGRVQGVEALVRWPHPDRGLIPPDAFIPLAEQTGLIAPLTVWVLEEALRQRAAWQRAGHDLAVAVNLSMWNLHDPALPDTIAALLQRDGTPAARLRLELTEGTVMADPARTLQVLTRLAALGVGLSVDDFGTGYSSLAYLKRLPVDELKIDKSFVQHLAEDEVDAAIVRSTIGLGHSLGLRVVAEGVEDRGALELLAQMGCAAAQGYYLSRPVPADALDHWLRATADADVAGAA